MFPQLPTLASLPTLSSFARPQAYATINPSPSPGPVFGPSIGSGAPCLFNCGGSSGGTASITSLFPGYGTVASATGSALSSALGIPAINWGRIAAFLLGLLLIGGGLYLIKPVQEVVNRTVKETARGAGEAVAA